MPARKMVFPLLIMFSHRVLMDFSLATASWAQGIFGELYTLDPFKYTIDAIKAGTANVDVSKEKAGRFRKRISKPYAW